MIPVLALLAGLLPLPALAQTPEPARIQAPSVTTDATPRPRPRDPRDRAFMDGGMAITPGFSGGILGGALPPTPQAQLAPRPNLELEARPIRPSQAPSLSPTMIHPRVPGRSTPTDSLPSHPDQRLLTAPAPGARLNVPLTW